MKSVDLSAVKNPLVTIALCMGVIQIAVGTAVGGVDEKLQPLFVIFITGFPILVGFGYFIVLIRWPHHLYARKDYRNDQRFLVALFSGLAPREARPPREKVGESTAPPLSADSVEYLARNIHRPFGFFLLRKANKPLTNAEALRRLNGEMAATAAFSTLQKAIVRTSEREGFSSKWIVKLAKDALSTGYFYGAANIYEGILVESQKDADGKIVLSASPEILTMIREGLGSQTRLD